MSWATEGTSGPPEPQALPSLVVAHLGLRRQGQVTTYR